MLYSLQALRAFAAWVVVCHHFMQIFFDFHASGPIGQLLADRGAVGVDIFFVISGYLITTILVAELDAGRFSILNFYERRARRILPALYLVMALCLPFAWLWLMPSDVKELSKSAMAWVSA